MPAARTASISGWQPASANSNACSQAASSVGRRRSELAAWPSVANRDGRSPHRGHPGDRARSAGARPTTAGQRRIALDLGAIVMLSQQRRACPLVAHAIRLEVHQRPLTVAAEQQIDLADFGSIRAGRGKGQFVMAHLGGQHLLVERMVAQVVEQSSRAAHGVVQPGTVGQAAGPGARLAPRRKRRIVRIAPGGDGLVHQLADDPGRRPALRRPRGHPPDAVGQHGTRRRRPDRRG